MRINSFPTTAIVTSVWANATRTLTAQLDQLLSTEVASQLSVVSSALQATLGAYTQVTPTTGHNVRGVILILSEVVVFQTQLVIATGAGGSEVTKAAVDVNFTSATQLPVIYLPIDPTVIPKGVRVALACANLGAAVQHTVIADVQLLEDNA